MRVPIDTSKFALIPDTVRLQTPDGTYTVTLEPFARTATVSRRQSPSAYRLDSVNVAVPPDADLIAAAQGLPMDWGFSRSPRPADRSSSSRFQAALQARRWTWCGRWWCMASL